MTVEQPGVVSLRRTLRERARTVTHHNCYDNVGVPFRLFAHSSSFISNAPQTPNNKIKKLADGLTQAAPRIERSGDKHTQ